MFLSQKRIFAGKSTLHQEPFCPVLTDEGGLISLRKAFPGFTDRAGDAPNIKPSARDGNHRI